MKRVIVIGGGASGLMASITAAREGAAVTILEAMEKPGKKILITGNGKCNLTNLDFSRKDLYRSDYPEHITTVLERFDHQDTISFFQELGLFTYHKNNGVYPITDQASSVTEILLMEARRRKVKIKCTEKAQKIYREDGHWMVKTNSWSYPADSVILACGSKSYPATGSDGSGYELAKGLKLKIIPPKPALVPLIIAENIPAKLSGIRSQAMVTLKIMGHGQQTASYTESGEVQWTDYGVSGIVIFQLSRYAVKALEDGKKPVLMIDILPQYEETTLKQFFDTRVKSGTLGDALTGILPKKMIPVMAGLSGLKTDAAFESLNEDAYIRLIRQMKGITLTVKGSKSFDMAQVCQGGVSLSEIDLSSMEAYKQPGIYVTGELLDVDGICGGYNLQWAFSTGFIAGKASAKEQND